MKEKYKCLKCGKILKDIDEINKHKENNFDHFEYELIGTKMKLGFC